jgi:hypothetical protein
MSDAPIRTVTRRFGFDRDDLQAIAAWWVESGQERWDKSAEATTPACEMEIQDFLDACVRGNLAAIKAELAAREPQKMKVRIKR